MLNALNSRHVYNKFNIGLSQDFNGNHFIALLQKLNNLISLNHIETMALLEKQLEVKTSTIPGAGKGLFTKKEITKGEVIIEYTGKVSTWKEVDHDNGNNAYIYYVNRNYVIDANKHLKSLARFANDARGLYKPKGFKNNAEYFKEKGRIYIRAAKKIPAGGEIMVAYGQEYWDVIKRNMEIDRHEKELKH